MLGFQSQAHMKTETVTVNETSSFYMTKQDDG